MARLRRQAMTWGRRWYDLGAVLGEGGVADVVQAVLDRPVPAEVVGEAGRAGLLEGQAGDRIDGHGPPPPRPELPVLGMTCMTWAACGKPKGSVAFAVGPSGR